VALTYASQKCDCCGGSLEYDKNRRIFVCLYCGNEIVRQETYDGQFSIKWVARQALLSLANREMQVAEEHIVECSKIDPHYVGTTIAQLAFGVVSLSLATDGERRRRLTSQVKDYYRTLRKTPLTPASDEEIFYESLDSSDAYGMLALIYDALGDEEREMFVADSVDPTNVYSAASAKDIVGYALSEGKFSLVDELLRSSAEFDRDFVFAQLLGRYPDSENKAGNVELVAGHVTSREDSQQRLDEYLSATSDGLATKLAISHSCLGAGIKPTISVCLASLLPLCGEEGQAKDVFDVVCGLKLNDEDVTGLMYYCTAAGSARLGSLGLDTVKSSGQFVTVTQANVLTVLRREDLTLAEKTSLLDHLYGFDLSERFRQGVISAFVREDTRRVDRADLLRYLVGSVKELNPALIEDYLMHFSGDGAEKSEIVAILLGKDANASILRRALTNYLAGSPDTPEVTQAVLTAFVSKGFAASELDVVSFACRTGDWEQSLVTIRSMKESGWEPGPRALDGYLTSCAKGVRFSPDVFSELLRPDGAISPEALCAYALCCADMDKVARISALTGLAGTASGSMRCRVNHSGKTIDCTLLQGYLLASPDSESVASGVMQHMSDGTGSVTSAISVSDASGTTTVKFKKYIAASKGTLSPAAREFAEKHKLLGGFF
jgi:predicted RNA-binding Zn-ribbon protein involved in translation (DUF1610 family)